MVVYKLYDIPNYDGVYKINKLGEVYSFAINKNGKLKKQQIDRKGYPCVELWKNNHNKIHRIHRLLAVLFIPCNDYSLDVNHKDGVKTNNALDNLEWVTRAENILHAHRLGLTNYSEKHRKISRALCLKKRYLSMEQANEIRELYKTSSLSFTEIGKQYGVSNQIVYLIIKNKTYVK